MQSRDDCQKLFRTIRILPSKEKRFFMYGIIKRQHNVTQLSKPPLPSTHLHLFAFITLLNETVKWLKYTRHGTVS